MFPKNQNGQYLLVIETKILNEIQNCLVEENIGIVKNGERFMKYFLKNSMSDGVLIKTIKEMTFDLNMPTSTLTKILNILEDQQIIYRRKGIIGVWRK